MQMIEINSPEAFRKYTGEETFSKIKEYNTVSEMWKHCLLEYADFVAIEEEGKQYTYKELEEMTARMRTLLLQEIGDHHSRIALLATNSIDFVTGYLAIVTSGCAALIFPPHLDEKSIYGCIMKYGIKALFYERKLEEKTKLAASKIATFPIGQEMDIEGTEAKDCHGEDEGVLMFTSGTTGNSKAAILSNRAVMVGTVNGCYGYQNVFHQRYMLALPLHHVFGLIRNLMTSLYTGSDLFICKDNKNLFRDIAYFHPTIFVTVPALAEMALTLSKQFRKNMLGNDLKTIIAGAAAVAPYLIKEYEQLGIQVCPGYGLTESANLVSGNPEGIKKPESVGIPYPHQSLRIVNGELQVKGEHMMKAYADEDAENPFLDGWFCTGDLARIDEDGFLYITGRCKEIIVLSNGENISPAEVEAVFNRIPLIQDSQVFEDVLESGQHILALEVVPRSAELSPIPVEEREACIMKALQEANLSLLPHQRVSRMVIRDRDFERSPSMKIVRYKKC